MSKIIAIDLETTGLDPEKGDMILEIGAVPIINNEVRREEAFERLVNPNKKIPPSISEINNITDEMVKDADPIESVLPEFLDYIEGSSLLAHNAPFDIGFLCYFARKLRLRSINNRVIDTIDISKELFGDNVHHNLDAVLQRLAIPFREELRHRSFQDAYLTALAFIKMKQML
jgi:DNA polymerase III epsilon subunit